MSTPPDVVQVRLFEVQYEVRVESMVHNISARLYARDLAHAKQRVHEEMHFGPMITDVDDMGMALLGLYEFQPGYSVHIVSAKEI